MPRRAAPHPATACRAQGPGPPRASPELQDAELSANEFCILRGQQALQTQRRNSKQQQQQAQVRRRSYDAGPRPLSPAPREEVRLQQEIDGVVQQIEEINARIWNFQSAEDCEQLACDKLALMNRKTKLQEQLAKAKAARDKQERQVWAGMHEKGKALRGGLRRGEAGGWRRLPKRLGAVTVGYKRH